MYRAHRFSYELHCGEIPAGMWVLHHCDNRPCVNPAHLFLGTNKDNVEDARLKGRKARKLSPDQVREIRELAERGVYQRDLMQRFGVGKTTITKVLQRKWHAHVV
jgi:hypothetical protein